MLCLPPPQLCVNGLIAADTAGGFTALGHTIIFSSDSDRRAWVCHIDNHAASHRWPADRAEWTSPPQPENSWGAAECAGEFTCGFKI
jgi:hypothetical protein